MKTLIKKGLMKIIEFIALIFGSIKKATIKTFNIIKSILKWAKRNWKNILLWIFVFIFISGFYQQSQGVAYNIGFEQGYSSALQQIATSGNIPAINPQTNQISLVPFQELCQGVIGR